MQQRHAIPTSSQERLLDEVKVVVVVVAVVAAAAAGGEPQGVVLMFWRSTTITVRGVVEVVVQVGDVISVDAAEIGFECFEWIEAVGTCVMEFEA